MSHHIYIYTILNIYISDYKHACSSMHHIDHIHASIPIHWLHFYACMSSCTMRRSYCDMYVSIKVNLPTQ